MAFETARKAIGIAMEDARRQSSDGTLGVIFFGGEPLLQRDLILRIARYCRELSERTGQSFHHKITTNGLLLDEEFLTSPETSGIFIAMSHDGVREAHDANKTDASGIGSFDRLEPVAGMLLRHKPYSPVMLVTTPQTVRHYADSVVYLYKKGFRYLICSLDYSGDWDEKSMDELGRQYRRLADWYYRETMAEQKFYFSPFEVKIASHVFPGSCLADRCELGRTQISVAPNGRLYPCVQFVGDGTDETYSIGHANTGIDEAARARLYEENAAEKATCLTCAIRSRCNHFCGCLNKQSTGSIHTVSPVLCVHERLILPIADRLAERLYKKRSPLFIQKHYNEMYPLLSLVEDAVSRSDPA